MPLFISPGFYCRRTFKYPSAPDFKTNKKAAVLGSRSSQISEKRLPGGPDANQSALREHTPVLELCKPPTTATFLPAGFSASVARTQQRQAGLLSDPWGGTRKPRGRRSSSPAPKRRKGFLLRFRAKKKPLLIKNCGSTTQLSPKNLSLHLFRRTMTL